MPGAAQSAADSHDGCNKQIYLPSLDPPDVAHVDVNQFGQPFLGHARRCANAPNVAAQVLKLRQRSRFCHATLRAIIRLDLEGVLRPNLLKTKAAYSCC